MSAAEGYCSLKWPKGMQTVLTADPEQCLWAQLWAATSSTTPTSWPQEAKATFLGSGPTERLTADTEEVLLAQLLPLGELDQAEPGRQVAASLLRLVGAHDRVCGRPGKVLHRQSNFEHAGRQG